MSKIHLDYGHGGRDPGAVNGRYKEAEQVLQIGELVTKDLERHGIVVVHSRRNDSTVSLASRTNKANRANTDILVSLHNNSFSNASANGIETFSYPGSRDGARLAKFLQEELVVTKLFKSNRGTKTANFHMLRESRMPGALVEIGFISNPADLKVILNNKKELAVAITKGILRYFNIRYKAGATKAPKPSNGDRELFYRVVTGSFNNRDHAEKRIAELKKAGFDSFIDIYNK